MTFLLKYLLLLIPVCLFLLALKNKQELKRLKSTGRIPDMDAANRNANLFTGLAIASLLGIGYLILKVL